MSEDITNKIELELKKFEISENEMKEKQEVTNTEIKSLKEKFEGIEKQNVELAKANGDLKNEVKNFDETLKKIELKKANSVVAVGGLSEVEVEYKKEIDNYLRKNVPVKEELVNKYSNFICKGVDHSLGDFNSEKGFLLETKTKQINNTGGDARNNSQQGKHESCTKS